MILDIKTIFLKAKPIFRGGGGGIAEFDDLLLFSEGNSVTYISKTRRATGLNFASGMFSCP